MTLQECRQLHIHDLVVSTRAKVLYGRVVAFTLQGAPVITFEDESHITVVFPSQAEPLRHVPHWKDLHLENDAEDDAA